MSETEQTHVMDRREAIRRVTILLGGVALVGGSGLLTACENAQRRAATSQGGAGKFTADDIALLDEVADTILPETKTPGAKAAHVGAFMALMVTDTYDDRDQQVFRDGMKQLKDASFMSATPAHPLSVSRYSSDSTVSRRHTGRRTGTTSHRRRHTTSAR